MGLLLTSAAAQVERPQRPAGTATPLGKEGAPPDAANALKRGTVPPGLAGRAADRGCREQAARMKLFGLGRHKFLQRCRRAARRKAPPR